MDPLTVLQAVVPVRGLAVLEPPLEATSYIRPNRVLVDLVVSRQRQPKCPHCGGPRYKVVGRDATECDCQDRPSCEHCNGRGFREIAGAPIKCVCRGGPAVRETWEPHTRARATDRPTSHAAAVAVCPNLSPGQWKVYNALKTLGEGIDQEIVKRIRERGHTVTPSGVRTRRSELVEIGLILDTGRTRKTEAGFDSVVWKPLKTAGHDVLGEPGA